MEASERDTVTFLELFFLSSLVKKDRALKIETLLTSPVFIHTTSAMK